MNYARPIKVIRPYRRAKGTDSRLTRDYGRYTKIAIQMPNEMFETIREQAERDGRPFAHEARRLIARAIASEQHRSAKA